MSAVIGIVVILAVIGLAAWAASPKRNRSKGGRFDDRSGGDNAGAAAKYGSGYNPP